MKEEITVKKSEESVKRDLDDVIIDGVAYYNGIPLKNFDKQQLITIIVLTTFEKPK